MKKKFRLGEIIKKINEEQTDSSGVTPDPNSAHSEKSTPSVKHSDSTEIRNSIDNLPDQPHIGSFSGNCQQSAARSAEINTSQIKTATINSDKSSPISVSDPSVQKPYSTADNNSCILPEQFSSNDEDDEDESFDLFRYIEIILRRKNAVLAIILIMTIFSVFRYLTGSKFFNANARLLFKPYSHEIVNDGPVYRYAGEYEKSFNTHLELLRSQSVLNIVSQNLNYKLSVEDISNGLVIKQGETNGQKNDIIELSFKNANAEMARDVLNELCKTYIDYRRDVNSQEVSRLIFKFETQINKLQEDLDKKESDLRLFKEENRMVRLSSETNLTVSKISDMELALQQTQLSLVETGERITVLNSQISRQEKDIVQSITYQDPFQNKLAALELELNSLTAEYSPEHFKVKMLKQQIENLKSAAIDSISREAASKTLVKNPIRQSLLQDLVNLTVEKSALEQKRVAQQKIIERLNLDLLKLPSLEQKYAYLERETESILQTLRMLKSKYEEAKIRRDSQESDLKLLEMAETPKKAVSRVGLTNIIIGILIGIILGIAFALLLEYLDQSLKNPRDVEKELDLPLLGVVPQIETNKVLLEKSNDSTKSVLEPFRALRANLKYIATQNNVKTFIICSAIKGEGKTTLSANLAITFSLDGKKVILVDGDLRRSQIHSLFGIDKSRGFSDYLLGSLSVDDIIKPTMYPNLFVVTSGERPDNPAELLGTYKFDLFLKEIRDKADFIIFDSPALLPVSDSITMAPKIDCCVMVVRTLWTPLKAAAQAKNQLKRIGTRIFGGILNGITVSKGYYPYYYGYYGYSHYKYSYEDDHNHHFSLRQIGLKIESKFRESVKNFGFAIPHYISTLGIVSKHIIKKKTFWILISLFLSLAATLLWLDSRAVTSDNDSIRYVGLGGIRNNHLTENVPKNDMAVPSTENSNDSISVKLDTVSINSTGLKDSIAFWVKALSEKDIDRYLQFYNSVNFKFANGTFSDLKRTTIAEFSNPKKSAIKLDSISKGKCGVSYVETIVHATSADSTKISCNLIWQIGSNGWKIVGQKMNKKGAANAKTL